MNLVQRIHATLNATVSNVVARVENHDAVTEAALDGTRASAAKARVRLSRIIKDGEIMRQKITELERMEILWTERAIASAKEDEPKALECLKRKNNCKQQLAQLKLSLARHEDVEREVSASVARIEQRLQELTQQRNLMRSRHSTAHALRVINQIEGNSSYGIENIFDRWEMLITETEYSNSSSPTSDTLDVAFTTQENDHALKAELHALLAEHTQS